jgi:hypothetical protein
MSERYGPPTCLGGEGRKLSWFIEAIRTGARWRRCPPLIYPTGLLMRRTILLSSLYAVAITMLAMPYGLSL